MNKNYSIVAALLLVVLGGWFYKSGLRHSDTLPNIPDKTIGGDKDAHGCLMGAGYSWCEGKNKCLRPWEEKCQ